MAFLRDTRPAGPNELAAVPHRTMSSDTAVPPPPPPPPSNPVASDFAHSSPTSMADETETLVQPKTQPQLQHPSSSSPSPSMADETQSPVQPQSQPQLQPQPHNPSSSPPSMTDDTQAPVQPHPQPQPHHPSSSSRSMADETQATVQPPLQPQPNHSSPPPSGDDDDDVVITGAFAGADGAAAATTNERVKGPWSPEEDALLSNLVEKLGARNPRALRHGCGSTEERPCNNSLLGPEFNEFEDHPPILNRSFASLVSKISSIAWMRSGLQSSDTGNLLQSVPPA